MSISKVEIINVRHVHGSDFNRAWAETFPGTSVVESTYPLVILETDEGLTGVGAGMEYCNELEVTVKRLEKYLLGRDPFDVARIGNLLAQSSRQYGTYLGCVDVALWDLIGKKCGQPIYRILGAYTDRVRPYASLGQLRSPQETVETVRRMRSEGYSAFKIRFHTTKPENELEVIQALRQEFGDSIDIMVDANQAHPEADHVWTFSTALRIARALEKMNVYYFEEPWHMDDLHGYRRLADAVDIPISGGEDEYNPERFRDSLDAYDIVQPDVTITGITAAKKIGAMAELKHKLCIPHAWSGGGIGLAANLQLIGSLSNCPFVEFPYDPPAWSIEVRDRFLKSPIVPRDGFVKIPDKPGIGVEVDWDKLRASTADW